MMNPATILPGGMASIQSLYRAMGRGGPSPETLELVHLRASQINGCSAHVHGGAAAARKAGISDERLGGLAAWRDSPSFTDAERAALSLTEAATRLSHRADAVPDDVWAEAAGHYDEQELAAIILTIALTNLSNRLDAMVRQPAGATWT